MAYLQQKQKTRFHWDPTYPKINMDSFPQFEWTKFYGDIKDAIPVDMPEPLEKNFDAYMMCDSDMQGTKDQDAPALVSWSFLIWP